MFIQTKLNQRGAKAEVDIVYNSFYITGGGQGFPLMTLVLGKVFKSGLLDFIAVKAIG